MSGLYTYTYENGDLVKQVWVRKNNSQILSSFTYFSEFDNREFGKSFEGKKNRHLLKSHIKEGKVNDRFDYSYTFDEQGRVRTETKTDPGEIVPI